MQARGFLRYRLKYCWPKVIHCICQPNELEREIKKKTRGPSRGPSKNMGVIAHPAPLRIATAVDVQGDAKKGHHQKSNNFQNFI